MISTEQERRATPAEQGTIRQFISERPVMQALRVGYHVRNEAEALDLLDLIQKIAPERIYTGLAGSRRVGMIAHTEEKIMRRFKGKVSRRVIQDIVKAWPSVAETADGRKPLVLPGVRLYELSRQPAKQFFYDVDAVVVPKQFDAESIYESHPGARSGTRMDIFVVSQERILYHDYPFYASVFFNSERLPYPYTATRKRINFDNIFRGWRNKA